MSLVLKGLLKSIPLMLVLTACVAAAARLESLGFGGVIITLVTILILTFIAGAAWAYYFPWTRAELVVSLLPVPVVVLVIVAYFSGFTGSELLHPFNLIYVAQICVGLGAPWLAGTLLGSRMRRSRRARS